MDEVSISLGTTAEDLQQRWPGTIPVLLRRGMACVGCPMARFDTVQDLATNYGVEVDELLDELNRATTLPPERPEALGHPGA